MKEGSDCKVLARAPRAGPLIGCGIPDIVRQSLPSHFQDTVVVGVKVVQFLFDSPLRSHREAHLLDHHHRSVAVQSFA